MGCPVPKVMKTGAGAALLQDADSAVAIARAAREGSGLPVTVKLRAEGVDVAKRLVEDAGVAGITFHPRTVKVRHKGTPDYDLAAQLVQDLPVPVIVTGGMDGADHVRWVFEYTGCEAVMLARGSLGNPWLFEQVLGTRDDEPAREEILAEWEWVLDRAEEHLGAERAARYLRKFHPWYVERLGAGHAVQDALQRAETLSEQRADHRGARCYHARPRQRLSALSRPPVCGRFLSPDPTPRTTTCRRTSSSPLKGSRSSSRRSSTSPPRSAERWPRASRKPASSATSRRTPSTTTPRTSRPCSRRASRRSRTSCARHR